jgi:tetratricopeptide (TPR) repeat protein
LNRQQSSPSPWPPLNRGALLSKLGKLADAETSLRESLRYDARFPIAHYELGRLLEKQSKYSEALQELRQAAANDPDYPDPHYALGEIYQRTGDKEQAQIEWGIFQKLKQEHPHMRVH